MASFLLFATFTSSFMERRVVEMRTINNWRWLYHWTKAEKALDKGDETKYKKHKDKMDRLLLLKIRRG